MKTRILLVSFFCALIAGPGLRAADRPARGEHAAGAGEHEHTELGDHMEKMGHAFRQLNRQIADPAKNEDSLKQVAIIRQNAEAAAKLTPAKAADVPAADRAKFVAEYQEDMKRFLADVDKLEAALKAGNNQEAAPLVKTLKKDMDSGHKEFRKKKNEM